MLAVDAAAIAGEGGVAREGAVRYRLRARDIVDGAAIAVCAISREGAVRYRQTAEARVVDGAAIAGACAIAGEGAVRHRQTPAVRVEDAAAAHAAGLAIGNGERVEGNVPGADVEDAHGVLTADGDAVPRAGNRHQVLANRQFAGEQDGVIAGEGDRPAGAAPQWPGAGCPRRCR